LQIPENIFQVTERGIDAEAADIVPPHKALMFFVGAAGVLTGVYQMLSLVQRDTTPSPREYVNANTPVAPLPKAEHGHGHGHSKH
jgi:predicted phage tail protein